MKHFSKFTTLLAAAALVLAGCAKTSDIENLQGQIDELKSDRIQTIEGQIKSIQTSITSLQNTDSALQSYITALQGQAAELEKTDSELESAIALLQAKDADLQKQIEELKAYVNGVIQSTKDWASATFATLDQYNATAGIVATIQSQVEAINAEIEEIMTNFATKDELNAAISASENSLKNWVNEQLTGYYTISQMDGKLTALQTGLEGQLATQKKELEAKINALENTESDNFKELTAQLDTVNAAIAKNSASIEQLKADLAAQKTEITAAYKAAIDEAINSIANGKLGGEISDKFSEINATISSLASRVSACENDIKSIKTTISSIQQSMDEMQKQISAILSRIQSITYVPKYSDGKAVMTYTDDGTVITGGTAVLDYQLKPASAADQIADLWSSTGSSDITMNAVYTITKSAPEFFQLGIESITADNGFISVTVSGKALKEAFFKGTCSANVSLCISDGNNDITTSYVPMAPDFAESKFKAFCIAKFDEDGDGEISAAEAESVKQIDCSNSGLTSLTGIERFTNLETLNASNNSLTSLDVSKCTSLTSLNVSNNTALKTLNYKEEVTITSGLAIGRYIKVNGVSGVTFYVSGTTTKIVSVDETNTTWNYYTKAALATSWDDGAANTDKIAAESKAAIWCRAKGSEWYLPALNELKEIYKCKPAINSTLSTIGETQLDNTYYWSSSETYSDHAYLLYFSNGYASDYNKCNSNNVRAVRAL